MTNDSPQYGDKKDFLFLETGLAEVYLPGEGAREVDPPDFWATPEEGEAVLRAALRRWVDDLDFVRAGAFSADALTVILWEQSRVVARTGVYDVNTLFGIL